MAIQNISNLPISASFENILQVSGSVIGTATGSQVDELTITASLATSASRATSAADADLATTASYVAAANVDGTVATATSASHAVNADIAITASHVTTTVNSASFATSASYAVSASVADLANSAGSATNASTASYVETAQTASYIAAANIDGTVTSASFSTTASFATSASYITTVVESSSYAETASYVETAQTASYIAGANVDGQVASALSASHAVNADTAIEATHADRIEIPARAAEALSKGDPVYVSGYNQGQERIEISKADAGDSNKMPVVGLVIEDVSQNTNTHVITNGSLEDVDTGDFNIGDILYVAVGSANGLTNVKPTGSALIQNVGKVGRSNQNNGEILVASIQRSNDVPNITENYLWVGNSDQVATPTDKDSLTVGTASLALDMPSNTNLSINTLTASFASITSASIGFLESITGSAKIIGDAFIIVNNDTPTERYAGIKVIDSGSVNTTASLQFDGQTNDWFYEYEGDDTDHGVVLFGPEYDTTGTPTYLTNNTIPKGDGGHHLNDSNITDDGTTVTIDSNLVASGSHTFKNFTVTPETAFSVGDGTTNFLQIDNSAFAAITGYTAIINGNTKVDGDFEITGDTNFTASQADQAQTASYVAGADVDGAVTTANTASYVETAQTASYVAAADIDGTVANATSASYATSASISEFDKNLNTNSGSIQFWQGNQSEYDAISGSATDNTIYFVVA